MWSQDVPMGQGEPGVKVQVGPMPLMMELVMIVMMELWS